MLRHPRGFTRLDVIAASLSCAIIMAIALPEIVQAKKHAQSAAIVSKETRDWNQCPAIAQVQDARVIYAIGDIHGDYDKAVKILVAAKLLQAAPATPDDAKWAGGTAVLVCTGDMIDKGPHAVEVVELMRALQADAAARGGRVIVTLGNHEGEFLAGGGEAHKSAEFARQLNDAGIDPRQVAAGTDAGGMGAWMRDLPAAAKVDDWFFSHAGNTHGESMKQLAADLETGIDQHGFAAPVLQYPDSILEARMHPVPWWDQGKTPGLTRLRQNAAVLDCDHLVAGHQPGKVKFGDHVERPKDEPFAYQGTLFLIDTGMSRGVDNGMPVVLKIDAGKREKVQVIDDAGAERMLWERK